MIQFSLKRLLMGTASIAAGCGMVMSVLTRKANPLANPYEWREPPRFDAIGITVWLLSGALIFGTICSFTKRPWPWAAVGAILGAFVMFVLFMRG